MGSGLCPLVMWPNQSDELAHQNSTVSRSEFSREIGQIGDRQTNIYFKELTYVIVGTGRFEICMVSQQGEDQAKLDAAALSLEAGNPGRIPVLQSGSRIPPSLGNLKGNMFALK